MPTYRVEFVTLGRRSTATYERGEPLQEGQWIEVSGVYLVVERIIAAKRGDPVAGIALCRLAAG